MIQLVTDSTCDLTPEIIQAYNISVVPMYVKFCDTVYKDGIDISSEEIYERVKANKEMPVTAAPTSSDFNEIFNHHVQEGKSIIYIGTSSKLASAIQNAKIAANEFKDHTIKVIDSLNISTGLGILVLQAAEYIQEGLELHEIETKLRETVPKVRTSFIIDTLDYLHKGGRCSSMENLMGNVLGIKPILHVVEGKLVLGEKSLGKRDKVLNSLIGQVLEEAPGISSRYIIITHSMALEEANYVKEQLSKALPDKEVIIVNAGCVISSHCGPNTLGVEYILEESPN